MLRNVLRHCCRPHSGPTFLGSLFHSTASTPSRRRFVSNEAEEDSGWRWRAREASAEGECGGFVEKEERVPHPWPEWIQLMKCLLDKGHLNVAAERRPFANDAKDSNLIRTASLNFGRDHSHLLRFLSQKDIGVTVAFGCPSLDRKVINSGKRLRAYVGLDEGNVCSSCNLRGDCERAFVKAREDEGGRTVDVMRILLTYGLDPIIGSVENKPCLTRKVEESVRRLLREIVEHSTKEENSSFIGATEVANGHVFSNQQDNGEIDVSTTKPGDWICPKCNFNNFARNIKCLRCDSFCEERIKQLQEDNNHLPLKKGDWICMKCNFLNFAKNTRCLQCKERPSNRHLNPGEWECDSCNYLNFRRNMVCLKCDHRRPIVSKAMSSSLQPQKEDKDSYSTFTFVGQENDGVDKLPMVFEGKNRKRAPHLWRFVEERSENNKFLIKSNDPSQSVDFPVAGGRTELSETKRREACKNKLPNRFRWQSESDCDLSSDNLSSDDDEMDEWFGKGKSKN